MCDIPFLSWRTSMIQDGLGNFLVDAKVTIHHYIPALQGTSPNTRASLSLSLCVCWGTRYFQFVVVEGQFEGYIVQPSC